MNTHVHQPYASRFEHVPNEPDVYIYRIENTGSSSARLGSCEVCDKHCSEVFYQVEGRTYLTDTLDDVSNQIAITHHECRNLFGHEDCLRRSRR